MEHVKRAYDMLQKAGCPVCLQEVDTYIDNGIIKIENHNYRNSEFQCPGSGNGLDSFFDES